MGRRTYGRSPPRAPDGLLPAGTNVHRAGWWGVPLREHRRPGEIVPLSRPIPGSLPEPYNPRDWLRQHSTCETGFLRSQRDTGSGWGPTGSTSRGPSTPAAAYARCYHLFVLASGQWCRPTARMLRVGCRFTERTWNECPARSRGMKESCQVEA